jgi:hypothetical protein
MNFFFTFDCSNLFFFVNETNNKTNQLIKSVNCFKEKQNWAQKEWSSIFFTLSIYGRLVIMGRSERSTLRRWLVASNMIHRLSPNLSTCIWAFFTRMKFRVESNFRAENVWIKLFHCIIKKKHEREKKLSHRFYFFLSSWTMQYNFDTCKWNCRKTFFETKRFHRKASSFS